ncbi:MAG: hypothetical protein QNL26_12115 [Acidimicrobiia bacterium]|nr:hypothetical protein [Acidimicrobiia bacterium]
MGITSAGPHKHRRARTTQRFWIDARVEEGFVADFEQHAQLWVHLFGLLAMHTKELRVKAGWGEYLAKAGRQTKQADRPTRIVFANHVNAVDEVVPELSG